MSCPYFYPLEPRSHLGGSRAAMLPLGDLWAGRCCAVPDHPFEPDNDTLRPFCNLGYARGACAHFPDHEGPDAVRFTISHHDGGELRISYSIERDHRPFAHGRLGYSVASERISGALPDENFSRQAQAYIQSYLTRIK